MQRVSQLTWALPLASALMLAACGGGGGATPADRQAGNSIAIGEPTPTVPLNTHPIRDPGPVVPFDTSEFVARAQNDTCADVRNRLFVIDNRYVFAERAGSCADASYSYSLYERGDPELPLCSQADSIAGPRLSCTEGYSKVMLEAIVAHLDAPDLGLGSGHKVEQIKFTVLNPSFVQIDRRTWSGIWTDRNVVVRDAASWEALWREHAGEEPLPRIDFSTTMVLGVFMGSVESGCYATEITGLARKDGKLIVTRTDTGPRSAGGALEDTQACIAAITSPAHLVRTARSDEPVGFSTVVPKTQ